MSKKRIIVFVCEHGAAKSILAAVHFNRLAGEMEWDLHAVARGANPDPELSPQTVKGLFEDGLIPTEVSPQKINVADVQSAERVIAFCELPVEYHQQGMIERWDDVPPVSENYEKARDEILKRIRQMLRS